MSSTQSKSQLGDLRQMDTYKSEHMKFLAGMSNIRNSNYMHGSIQVNILITWDTVSKQGCDFCVLRFIAMQKKVTLCYGNFVLVTWQIVVYIWLVLIHESMLLFE